MATDSSTVELQKYEVCSDLVDLLFDIAYIYGGGDDDELNYVANSSAVVRLSNGPRRSWSSDNMHFRACQFEWSEMGKGVLFLKLNVCLIWYPTDPSGYILLLIEVSEYLALVSIIRADTFDNSKGWGLSL